MAAALIHLATGLQVCSAQRTWCGAPVLVVRNQVTNATAERERATCPACLQRLQEAEQAPTEQHQVPAGDRRTGRTYRQVGEAVHLALEGKHVAYVVPTSAMVGYVLDMLRDHFTRGRVTFSRTMARADYGTGSIRVLVPLHEDDQRLRGLAVVVDHACELVP